jgi:hypothetical protein
MSKKSKRIIYEAGEFYRLLDRIAKYYGDDPIHLRALVFKNYPQFKNKTRCPNCGSSMAIYWFSVDYLTASLLFEMGKLVRDKIKKRGISFREANKIHIVSEVAGYSLQSRNTQASKLGLIAKVLKKTSTGKTVHDTKAGWLITKRGYDFLRGERVPRKVSVFRNKIQEHTEDMITFSEAINTVRSLKIGEYDGNDWVDIEGYAQGTLI